MSIPVINITGKTIAESYERALLELYHKGTRIFTQYDKEGDPPSLDCTANITIEEPLSDPMIHKCFPGSLSDLHEYVLELKGNKDNWIRNSDDPKDTRWEYTYHQRFKNYGAIKYTAGWNVAGVDQIDNVIKKLTKSPNSRQAQMITWDPWIDGNCYDPPCCQSIWLRIHQCKLNANIRFRSNDAWGAAFMNMFGLTWFIHDVILGELNAKSKDEIQLGRINWQADSFHIYGKDIRDFNERLVAKVLINNRPFNQRTYNFWDPEIQEMYYENQAEIIKKINEQNEKYKKIDGN